MKKNVIGIFVCMLLIVATVLPVAGIVDISKNKTMNNAQGDATFIAHFMTPEGDPHPFDVIISDGEWRQEWKNITYLNTSVPLKATYTFYYRYGDWEGYRYKEFALLPDEVMEIELYAYNSSEMEFYRPCFLYKEVSFDFNLTWNWDPEEGNASWHVDPEPPDGTSDIVLPYGAIDPDSWGDMTSCEIEEVWNYNNDPPTSGGGDGGGEHCDPPHPSPPIGIDEDCGRRWHYTTNHSAGGKKRNGHYHGYAILKEIDINMAAIKIGYGLYNDAIILSKMETLLHDPSGTIYEEGHVSPQYIVAPNHYILTPTNIPEGYITIEYTIYMYRPMCIDINNFYLLKIAELSDLKFFVAAESFYSNSNYSDPLEDPDLRIITVNVSTETLYDWWGCFVLPDTVAVDTLIAYNNETPCELNRWYNYTINRVGDYNLIVVRIDANTTSLKLEYCEDPTPPQLEKVTPKGIYLFEKEIIPFPFDFALVIGKITLSAEATDEESKVGCVEFYIDDEMKHRCIEGPYTWLWDELSFGIHTMKMIAHDNAKNSVTKEITVLKFL